MDTNESLSLETFPKSYEACFLENCAVREDCLHHLYFKLQPTSNTWGDAIFPSALMPENLVNGCCRMYQAKKLVTCYVGFTHFFDEVRRKDLPSLRKEVYTYFRGRMGLHGIVFLYVETIFKDLFSLDYIFLTFTGKLLLSSISLLLLYYPIIWIQKYFPIVMGGRSRYGRE